MLNIRNSDYNLCFRASATANKQLVENAIGSNNSAYLSHQRVEQYFKSLSTDGTAKGVYPTLTHHKQIMKAKAASEKVYLYTTTKTIP